MGGQKSVKVVCSHSTNPADNLALEAQLFEDAEYRGTQNTLLFYVDSPCLVKGSHRSPSYGWYNEQLAAQLGVPVYQRITGGGVVYHDYGNLNWCLVVRTVQRTLSPKEVFGEGSKYIVEALRSLGIKAYFSAPNRLDVNGHKVSGMAAYSGLKALLIHGTLLIQSDLELINRICVPPAGCPSVANINEYLEVYPSQVAEAVCQALLDAGYRLEGKSDDAFKCLDERLPSVSPSNPNN